MSISETEALKLINELETQQQESLKLIELLLAERCRNQETITELKTQIEESSNPLWLLKIKRHDEIYWYFYKADNDDEFYKMFVNREANNDLLEMLKLSDDDQVLVNKSPSSLIDEHQKLLLEYSNDQNELYQQVEQWTKDNYDDILYFVKNIVAKNGLEKIESGTIIYDSF